MYTNPEIPRVYAEKMQKPTGKQKPVQTPNAIQTPNQETQKNGGLSPILLLLFLDLLS